MMHPRFSLGLVLSLGALSALSAGCEVSTCTGDDCDFGDGSLFDGDDFDGDEDGSDGNDDGSDGSDLDAGTDGDAGEDGSDGDADGSDGDADGSDDALDLEGFCIEQLRVGADWESAFSACCTPQPEAKDAFLTNVLAYPTTLPNGESPQQACVRFRQANVDSGNVTFDGTKAQACADAFVAAYDAPPAGCPSEGFDLKALEGTIGKGAPQLKQLAACRETFVGKLASGATCTDHLECAGALRCLPMSGSGSSVTKSCQDPVGNASICYSASDCDDGLVCLGLTGAGDDGVCRPANALSSFSAECGRSSQCEEGLICDENVCATAEGGTLECVE